MDNSKITDAIGQLDQEQLSTWIEHALTQNFIEPIPNFRRDAGSAFIAELHDTATGPFKRKIRQTLFDIFLSKLNRVLHSVSGNEFETDKEDLWILTLCFGKIHSFRNYRGPIGNILLKEGDKLILHRYGPSLSFYSILLNLYVLWTNGDEDERFEIDTHESIILSEYFDNLIQNRASVLAGEQNILLTVGKFYATKRSILEFFQFYAKVSKISEIVIEEKVELLDQLFRFLCIIKKKYKTIETLNGVFHAFIEYAIDCTDELLTEKLYSKLLKWIDQFDTRSDAYFSLRCLLGDSDAFEQFESDEQGVFYVNPATNLPIVLDRSYYAVIWHKTNSKRSARNSPVMEDVQNIINGIQLKVNSVE